MENEDGFGIARMCVFLLFHISCSFALFHRQVLVMYPQIETKDHLLQCLVRCYDQKGAKRFFDSISDALWLTGS
jgi:hypothetical protein